MAGRPTKTWLDWIRLEITFFDDDDIVHLAEVVGPVAPLVYLALLATIYSSANKTNGWFIEDSARVPFMLSRKIPGCDSETAKETIYHCLEIGLLDKSAAENYEALTSRGIFLRWYRGLKTGVPERIKNNFGSRNNLFRNYLDYVIGISGQTMTITDDEIPIIDDVMQQNRTEQNRTDKNREDILSGTPDITPLVIDYLNQKTGHTYQVTSANRRRIRARSSEITGDKLKAFQSVIDSKVGEWSGTKMAKYLRPETLFSTKFDSYLAQCKDAKDWSAYDA